MSETLVATGLACIIAAIVGGGLKAAGNEFPPIASLQRQLLLAALGLVLVPLGLIAPWEAKPSRGPDGSVSPTPSVTPRATETAAPAGRPIPVELHGPAGPLQRGFFTPGGKVISTSEAAGAGELSVHWRDDGREVEVPARVVDTQAQLVLIELDVGTGPRVAFSVGRAVTLRRGDEIEAFLSPSEQSRGRVLEVGASRAIQGVGTLHDLLVTSRLGGQGDSGAPILDEEGALVAVFYGQSPREAVSIPIESVRAHFEAAF
jgi:hypothetical protein